MPAANFRDLHAATSVFVFYPNFFFHIFFSFHQSKYLFKTRMAYISLVAEKEKSLNVMCHLYMYAHIYVPSGENLFPNDKPRKI